MPGRVRFPAGAAVVLETSGMVGSQPTSVTDTSFPMIVTLSVAGTGHPGIRRLESTSC